MSLLVSRDFTEYIKKLLDLACCLYVSSFLAEELMLVHLAFASY